MKILIVVIWYCVSHRMWVSIFWRQYIPPVGCCFWYSARRLSTGVYFTLDYTRISRGSSWWPMSHIPSSVSTSSPISSSWWTANTTAYWTGSHCTGPSHQLADSQCQDHQWRHTSRQPPHQAPKPTSDTPKCWYSLLRLHTVITLKTRIWIFAAMYFLLRWRQFVPPK